MGVGMQLSLLASLGLAISLACGMALAEGEVEAEVSFYRGSPYDLELLQRALELTETSHGKIKLQHIKTRLSKHSLTVLSQGLADVIVTPRYRSIKTNMVLPVEVPILQGMLGYRLLLTTPQSDSKIIEANSLVAYQKRLIGGAGLYWDDFSIYLHNKLLVKTAADSRQLLQMLLEGEIDYFGRGVNEVFYEYDRQVKAHPQLQISSGAALYYHLPLYYYVSANNPKLAQRIEKGLLLAEQDGSFRRLFNKHFHNAIQGLRRIAPKKLFFLENPDLTLKRKIHFKWWLGDEMPAPPASAVEVSLGSAEQSQRRKD